MINGQCILPLSDAKLVWPRKTHAWMGKHTSTLVPVNTSKWTVFTKKIEVGWGQKWFRRMAPGSDRMLGDVSFSPDSLGDEGTHKEILLHTEMYTDPYTHTKSLTHSYISATHPYKWLFGRVVSRWAQRKHLLASPPPPPCFGLRAHHTDADYIKRLLDPYISSFHSAPRAEQELVCHCS